MKKSLILILLIICMPFSYSIDIEEVSVGEPEKLEEISEGMTRYVYGIGLVASVKNSDINYYHSDRIQSNRIITNIDGEIKKEFKSLPFGQEIENSGVKYAFATGKELDSSELYYFGARYYDSNLGRFTSVDPAKENHAYSYVANNPNYFVDPTGEVLESAWDVASLSLSLTDFKKHPGWLSGAAVVIDVTAVTLPFIPGGAGIILKGIRANQIASNIKKVGGGLFKHRKDVKLASSRAAKILGFGDSQKSHLKRLVEQHDYTKLNPDFIALQDEATALRNAGKSTEHMTDAFRASHNELHHIASHNNIVDDLIKRGASKEVIENIVLENSIDWVGAAIRRAPKNAAGNVQGLSITKAIKAYKASPDFAKAVDILGEKRALEFVDATRRSYDELIQLENKL